MIGKVIGIIIVIISLVGILYSIGLHRDSQENRDGDTGPVSVGTVDLKSIDHLDRENFEVHAYGTVKNDGNKDANNVILQIIFYRNHVQIDEKKIRVGDVGGGDQKDYDEKFTLDSSRYPDDDETKSRWQYN